MPSGLKAYRRQISFLLAVLVPFAAALFALHVHFKPSFYSTRPSQSALAGSEAHPSLQQPFTPTLKLKPELSASADNRLLIGVEVTNTYELSLKDRLFMAEGIYWLKWPENVNTMIGNSGVSPEKIIRFRNQVESDSFLVESDQLKPRRMANGNYWQTFHFSGKFYIPDLELRGFPFDVLNLPIVMEIDPESLSCQQGSQGGCVGLAFDHSTMSPILGEYASMNGYETLGSRAYEYTRVYSRGHGNGRPSSHAAVEVDMLYRTDPVVSVWGFLFPLFLLIGIAILAPSLPGSLGDVRLAIPTTILLTLIFLQIGYQSDLPPLGYVTFLDWLYIYAYAVSSSLFLLFLWGTNTYAQACIKGDEEMAVRRIDRVDAIFQLLAFLGLLAVITSGLAFQP